MKNSLKRLLKLFGLKIERISNPNPLEKKYNELICELNHTLFNIDNSITLNKPNLEFISKLDGTQVSEALFILDSLQKTQNIDGDVCEFGVAQGLTSTFIAYNLNPENKQLWLYDSFEGLPKPTIHDQLKDDIFNLGDINSYQGTMKHDQTTLINNIKKSKIDLSKVKIIAGFIEKTIPFDNLPDKVSFAYIDFDFYEPIKIALESLHELVPKNGIIIVDDYDFFSTGAKKAVDEFLEVHKGQYLNSIYKPPIGGFAILTKI